MISTAAERAVVAWPPRGRDAPDAVKLGEVPVNRSLSDSVTESLTESDSPESSTGSHGARRTVAVVDCLSGRHWTPHWSRDWTVRQTMS